MALIGRSIRLHSSPLLEVFRMMKRDQAPISSLLDQIDVPGIGRRPRLTMAADDIR